MKLSFNSAEELLTQSHSSSAGAVGAIAAYASDRECP
jgi:hypothetical protein